MKEFAGKKITKTSFLDDSFRKNLESALRFGNPLLVQVRFQELGWTGRRQLYFGMSNLRSWLVPFLPLVMNYSVL